MALNRGDGIGNGVGDFETEKNLIIIAKFSPETHQMPPPQLHKNAAADRVGFMGTN